MSDTTIRYRRRATHAVPVGGVSLGGDNPVRVQSMTTTRTLDTESSVNQILQLAQAGAEYVRLTAQGVREAQNLAEIRRLVRQAGCEVPIVADIHFNTRAAFAAAEAVDKVRINPGNFVDPGRVFKIIDYTDEQYAAELNRLRDTLVPLLKLCAARGTALRLGVNHGSLSDRIMSRYGDTPEGMVESAMEFLRVCRDEHFDNVVVSIKASNPVVMVRTMRLLDRAMAAENMTYPLHLGVTEAGDGEDGRIKSAVGIGTLLLEGLGDTIRVSLSEDPCNEIPVARSILDIVAETASAPAIHVPAALVCHNDRAIHLTDSEGRTLPVVVAGADIDRATLPAPTDAALLLDPTFTPPAGDDPLLLTTDHAAPAAMIRAAIGALRARGLNNPVIVRREYSDAPDTASLRAAIDLGPLLLDGLLAGIDLHVDSMPDEDVRRLSFTLLQATRARITRTEYIACPGCGRTMFDLRATLDSVRRATSHLPGLKIGVMGCVVNGPGEMADADYGYVGAGVGCVSLYRGRECVARNIPETEAPARLLELIQSDMGAGDTCADDC